MRNARMVLLALSVAIILASMAACGGGSGGAESGRGLALLSFAQDSVDNVSLNARLIFNFSESVDPSSITNASIQIRQGGQFGLTVPGLFVVQGSTVVFEPVLATLCDHSDSGLRPDTEYRVQVIGFPEEFSVRNASGQPLAATTTLQFHTRPDGDPAQYTDQIPSVGPSVVSTFPANGEQAVAVAPGNRIEIELSENVEPCTVSGRSVQVAMYEGGDSGVMAPVPGSSPTRYSGFAKAGSTADQTPNDPYTWGADGTTSYAAAPRVILCRLVLVQDFSATRLVLYPLLGYNADPAKNASRFPENALIVVRLTFDIVDYGGLPLEPTVFAFTTANLPMQTNEYLIENKGETQYIDADTTAAVHPDPRAVERVQGYMLFAGDGDNGSDPSAPTLPKDLASGCLFDLQTNDGTLDEFDPQADTLLDTGAVENVCTNSTDGSEAVVWEFSTFRIRSGITVRVVGLNPAIILVQGDVLIEAGGRLLLRADGQGGMPQGRGQNGYAWTSYSTSIMKGGVGVAGAGAGGDARQFEKGPAGKDGFTGYGSPDGPGVEGGEGAGLGGTAHDTTYPSSPGTAQGGGGGGHAEPGVTATNVLGPAHTNQGPTRGDGGAPYPDVAGAERMLKPSAGSGGGAGGNEEWDGSYDGVYSTGGGAGGAGGGFVDLTSSGSIYVFGTIDASGSQAGDGGSSAYYAGPGGGGGGSGGGIRLLTPNEIVLGPASVVTATGGLGGNSPNGNSGTGGPQNHGGAGGSGRIVMEDADSVISGLGAAAVTPGEGDVGFYRGLFDAGRFQGGGLRPKAVTELIPLGNYAGFDPVLLEPVQSYGGNMDFVAGIPVQGSPGPLTTALMIEVRGYQMQADGTADLASQTGWVTVGYFRDSGVEAAPTWFIGHPSDVTVPSDNTGGGGGFGELNAIGGGGFEFLQFRFTIQIPATAGPFDPGAYLDDWRIRFTHDH